jgi:hypothetical protein
MLKLHIAFKYQDLFQYIYELAKEYPGDPNLIMSRAIKPLRNYLIDFSPLDLSHAW